MEERIAELEAALASATATSSTVGIVPTTIPATATTVVTPTTALLTVPPSISFYFDEGVGDADRGAIMTGVAIAHDYLQSVLGGDETTAWRDASGNGLVVSVYTSADPEESEGCCHGLTLGSDGQLRPGPRFYVSGRSWADGFQPAEVRHAKDSAHEYAHNWQAVNGCVANFGNPLGRWLTEGMAEYIAWNAVIRAGLTSESELLRWNVEYATSAATGPPDWELWEDSDNPSFRHWSYPYSFLATRRLVDEYGGANVLRDICEEVARLAPTSGVHDHLNMRSAFENLGIDRGQLYADMDRYVAELQQLLDVEVPPDLDSFDSSVCIGDGPSISGASLECLGSAVDETHGLVYAFRIIGFRTLDQPVGVMNSVDARSSCGRDEWGRYQYEEGQIMWIQLLDQGDCEVSLNLPEGVVITSTVVVTPGG